jgi:hypothetical protein
VKSNITEGLRHKDLQGMIYPQFEIDTFRSKMGEDQDVSVVAFQVRERLPAKDLMEFVERGYDFVLDADVSSGENNKGEYTVFVEIERSPKIAENINELLYGVKKLSGIDDFSFKYYKFDEQISVSEQNLRENIPLSAEQYQSKLREYRTNTTRDFFDKTVMDSLELDGDTLKIIKPFGQTVELEIIESGNQQTILQNIDATLIEDESSMGEIFWLTKVLGDYNISKYGDSFMFSNKDQAMLLKRRN